MSRGDPVFEPLEAFVERWLPLEDKRDTMLVELRKLIVETDPAVKALAAGYGLGTLTLERQLAIDLLRYEVETNGNHRGADCTCDACKFLARAT